MGVVCRLPAMVWRHQCIRPSVRPLLLFLASSSGLGQDGAAAHSLLPRAGLAYHPEALRRGGPWLYKPCPKLYKFVGMRLFETLSYTAGVRKEQEPSIPSYFSERLFPPKRWNNCGNQRKRRKYVVYRKRFVLQSCLHPNMISALDP